MITPNRTIIFKHVFKITHKNFLLLHDPVPWYVLCGGDKTKTERYDRKYRIDSFSFIVVHTRYCPQGILLFCKIKSNFR